MRDCFLILVFFGIFTTLVSTANVTGKHLDENQYGRRKCSCRCGESNEDSRILGGEETSINKYPWMARLSYFNKFYCGAMAVNDRYVLTAGHCVKNLMWFMIKVTFGEHNRCNTTRRPETRHVIQAIAHDFNFKTFKDDIALLKLNERLTITNFIKPVCLPHDDGNNYDGVMATATGWGSVSELKNHSCYPREVQVPIMNNEKCQNTKYNADMIADTMMCAGYPDTGQKDACQGDSGGPLVAERADKRFEVLGIVSWGIGCGRPGYPGVYTRVTKYLYWIRHNARSGCFCSD